MRCVSLGFSRVLVGKRAVIEVMGVVSSGSPGSGARVGDLIDWLPDWRDPAECERSVCQTVLGQEDCTQGMMGNE